jgi:glycosyltransferase involved in cell wall biosynthesis
MTTLSLAMIVRDAEQTLARALKSVVELCDELIVVDTGSLDDSVEIARRMGAKVHEFAWIDDFAAARNHSFQLCTGDWIMWLDADDLISEESRRRLLAVKSGSCSEAIDGIFMPYQQSFTSDGKCEMTSYREGTTQCMNASTCHQNARFTCTTFSSNTDRAGRVGQPSNLSGILKFLRRL